MLTTSRPKNLICYDLARGNLRERNSFEDLGVARKILKWIVKKQYDGREMIWLRINEGGRLL
jgi:hypothetical protein